MKRKLQSGDRVRVKPNSWVGLVYGVDYVGTVIGYDENEHILVKFDNFTNGHDGWRYYSNKGIDYDPKNRQHLYVRERDLCLL